MKCRQKIRSGGGGEKPFSMHASVFFNIEQNRSINEALLLQFLGKPPEATEEEHVVTTMCGPGHRLRCKKKRPPENRDGIQEATARRVDQALLQEFASKQTEPARNAVQRKPARIRPFSNGRHKQESAQSREDVYFANVPKIAESNLLALLDFLDADDEIGSFQSFGSFDTLGSFSSSVYTDHSSTLTSNQSFWGINR